MLHYYSRNFRYLFLFKFEPLNYEQIGNIRVIITHVIIEYE